MAHILDIAYKVQVSLLQDSGSLFKLKALEGNIDYYIARQILTLTCRRNKVGLIFNTVLW